MRFKGFYIKHEELAYYLEAAKQEGIEASYIEFGKGYLIDCTEADFDKLTDAASEIHVTEDNW